MPPKASSTLATVEGVVAGNGNCNRRKLGWNRWLYNRWKWRQL